MYDFFVSKLGDDTDTSYPMHHRHWLVLENAFMVAHDNLIIERHKQESSSKHGDR